ncbi:hypothetical protein BKA82DRAFT_4016989 [Pisolithus tinctorius]|nr:hypothetical protein BKA82DRAFT_4016989 [Pisolithus tinctorius]
MGHWGALSPNEAVSDGQSEVTSPWDSGHGEVLGSGRHSKVAAKGHDGALGEDRSDPRPYCDLLHVAHADTKAVYTGKLAQLADDLEEDCRLKSWKPRLELLNYTQRSQNFTLSVPYKDHSYRHCPKSSVVYRDPGWQKITVLLLRAAVVGWGGAARDMGDQWGHDQHYPRKGQRSHGDGGDQCPWGQVGCERWDATIHRWKQEGEDP